MLTGDGMKLYLVTCRGMRESMTGVAYGTAYVVAMNAEDAYQQVRGALDNGDIGFEDDREMLSVTLLAESTDYPSCRTRLYLP